jgi:hypothetical protein
LNSTQFERVSKELATGATRRRALAGLGALALGGVGVVGLTRDAAADDRRRCIERCVNHGGDGISLRKLRHRCRRRCEDR